MDIICRWWRIIFYLIGLCGLIWGLTTGNSNAGIMLWLCCSNIILVPIIAEETLCAYIGDDDED